MAVITLVSPFSSFAEIQVLNGEEPGSVLLRAKNCEELQIQVNAMVAWNRNLGGEIEDPELNCELNPKTSIEISKLIPVWVRKIYGKPFRVIGPNCYNSAMIGSRIHQQTRYVSNVEMEQVLDASCNQLDNGELPQAGDIGVIINLDTEDYDDDEDEDDNYFVHGFVYVSDQLVFSKNGQYISTVPKLSLSEEIYRN